MTSFAIYAGAAIFIILLFALVFKIIAKEEKLLAEQWRKYDRMQGKFEDGGQ